MDEFVSAKEKEFLVSLSSWFVVYFFPCSLVRSSFATVFVWQELLAFGDLTLAVGNVQQRMDRNKATKKKNVRIFLRHAKRVGDEQREKKFFSLECSLRRLLSTDISKRKTKNLLIIFSSTFFIVSRLCSFDSIFNDENLRRLNVDS